MPLCSSYGGTGIPADMIKKAISLGGVKINVNTEWPACTCWLHCKYIEEGKDQQVKDMTHVSFL